METSYSYFVKETSAMLTNIYVIPATLHYKPVNYSKMRVCQFVSVCVCVQESQWGLFFGELITATVLPWWRSQLEATWREGDRKMEGDRADEHTEGQCKQR